MNLLSVENLSKSFGMRVLFENLSFGINQGDKVALIAKNGSGKSTLFSMLYGDDAPDTGKITFRKDIKIAFLKQEPDLDLNKTVIETIFASDTPTVNAIREYEEVCLALETDPENMDLIEKQIDLSGLLSTLDAWDFEQKAKTMLTALQITRFNQPISSLSGGQKKRVALTQVLLSEPDFLILDEPTNHLDLQMIEWLEGYLDNKNLSFLIVTHDRYFLNNVCNKIIELDNKVLFTYQGNFEYYLEKKAERQMISAAEHDKVKNLYNRELEWVRKQPKARTTKSKSRVDAFAEIAQRAAKRKEQAAIEMQVKSTRLGGKILELIKVSKGYEHKVLLDQFSYVFKRGEKIGIIGPNGCGKSTLLNIIMSLLEPDAGKISVGETVVFGYYNQTGLVINDETKRVIEIVKDYGEFIPMSDGTKLSASGLLTRFHFPPEMQYNHVSKLSGGEKRRLFLCTLLIKNPNFLILDEPTNDLDIITLQALEEFMIEFGGCALIVSHDRYFMDKIVDHVFVFEGQGNIKDYPGNYSDYRMYKELQDQEDAEKAKSAKVVVKEEKKVEIPVEKTVEQKATVAVSTKKLSYKEKLELETLEKEMPVLEAKQRDLTEQLSANASNFDVFSKITKDLELVSNELETKSMRWLELSE